MNEADVDGTQLLNMQRYVARVAITPSVFRRQSSGFVAAAREFLCNSDLKLLKNLDASEYPIWLDTQTSLLMQRFPVPTRWGHARKCINIFMTMASLNRFLCSAYALERLEHVFEVPLDNEVESKLRKFGRAKGMLGKQFPKWTGITALDSANSGKYQLIAQAVATSKRIPRGRLDCVLWSSDK